VVILGIKYAEKAGEEEKEEEEKEVKVAAKEVMERGRVPFSEFVANYGKLGGFAQVYLRSKTGAVL
jgi:hypothetical protein